MNQRRRQICACVYKFGMGLQQLLVFARRGCEVSSLLSGNGCLELLLDASALSEYHRRHQNGEKDGTAHSGLQAHFRIVDTGVCSS